MHTKSELDALVSGIKSASDRIRALHRAGLRSGDIADYLGLKPNHVYSTISRDKVNAKIDKAPRRSERAAPNPEEIVVMMYGNENGELVIPAEVHRAMRLEDNAQLVAFAAPGRLTVMTREAAARHLEVALRDTAPAEAKLAAVLLQNALAQ